MYLTRYEPWGLLNQFYRDLDKVLGHGAEHAADDSTAATSAWVPAVDIKEDGQNFLIEADIPGVEPKDIEIAMENGVLTIKGERQTESRDEGNNYQRVERIHGSFYRRFTLPDTADPERVSATGKNGVLQITIPKREVAKPRKIEIKI
jgi:HSP20 family protein